MTHTEKKRDLSDNQNTSDNKVLKFEWREREREEVMK